MLQALRVRDFRLLWSANLVSGLGSWLLALQPRRRCWPLRPTHCWRPASSSLPSTCRSCCSARSRASWPTGWIVGSSWSVPTCCALPPSPCCSPLTRRRGSCTWPYSSRAPQPVVFVPAMQAHVPTVVGTGRLLSSANALNAINNGTVRLVGGPLGAALLLAAGFPVLVAIDVATYLLSAVAIALTRPRGRPDPRGGRSSFRAGLQVLRGHPWSALPATGVFLLANAALSALLVPLGIQRLGGATAIGLVLSALGARIPPWRSVASTPRGPNADPPLLSVPRP